MNYERKFHVMGDEMVAEGDSEAGLVSPKASKPSNLDTGFSGDQLDSISALEILRETVRILRSNSFPFLLITTVLISPVSLILLSNVLVDQSIVSRLTLKLLLASKYIGLPPWFVVKHSCYRISETAVSSLTSFPLFLTSLLLSKAAIAYSVDCSYSRKEVEFSKLRSTVSRIWRNVVSSYLWGCGLVVSWVTLFCVILVGLCGFFSWVGLQSELNLLIGLTVGLIFSVVFANAVVVCSVAVAVSVLEEVGGYGAFVRASGLIRGNIQVGLLMYLGSVVGMSFVRGLFDHRVRTLSYGDGSSRIWEGPLLVIMYSFVVLIYSMMSCVFYFSCKLQENGVLEADCCHSFGEPDMGQCNEFNGDC